MTTIPRNSSVRPGIGPIRLALPPLLVMALAAAPVGFIGASVVDLEHYGGFDTVGELADFLSDMLPLIVIAVAVSVVGIAALARACFVPGRRSAPVAFGLLLSYVLGSGAVVLSTFPRDPISTIVFLLLGLALVSPSLAFLWFRRR